MNSHQLVNQTSGNTEWYTPAELVEAARRVMGGIDLDPASSERANAEIVKAKEFYAAPDYFEVIDGELPTCYYSTWGGAGKDWYGRVWLNHPFGNAESACKVGCTKKTCPKRGYHIGRDLPGSADWIGNLVRNYKLGHMTEACNICFAATSEAWFRPLKDFPMCFIDGRTNYLDPVTLQPVSGVTKGSVVTYLGPNIDKFVKEYSEFGSVMIPAQLAKF